MRRPRVRWQRRPGHLWLNPATLHEQRPHKATDLERDARRHRRAHHDRGQPDRHRPLDADLRRGSARLGMAEEQEEQKQGEEPARETAVGHQVVDADAAKSDSDTTEVFFSKDEPAAGQPQPAAAPPQEPSGTSPAAADRQAADDKDEFASKPEVYVAGAFVGAFVFAKVLKKLFGSDD